MLGCVLLGSALGVLKKAGVDVPPAALVGLPVLVGAGAWRLQRGRRARVAPDDRRRGGAGMTTRLTHLQELESEAIHVMREVAAELPSPCCCSAAARTRSCCCASPRRRFARPLPVPAHARRHGPQLPRGDRVPRPPRRRARRAADRRLACRSRSTHGRVAEETGPRASRNRLQTTTLLDAIEEHGFDAAFGGARRDEERARAKERIFSFRDDFGGWDPKNQRPELWNLYNGRIRRGESVRVFPISNWTELDVWQYLALEELEVPSIYFAHEREVFQRDGMLYAMSEHVQLIDGEVPFTESVRYRTVGDMSCTGAVRSTAADLGTVVAEIAATRITERGETRADDRATEAAMEDRKVAGYF